MRPFYIALIVSAFGLLILLLRSIYCLAAGTGQAKKEYAALLSSGLMGEAEETGPPAADPVLSGKLKSAMDEAKNGEGARLFAGRAEKPAPKPEAFAGKAEKTAQMQKAFTDKAEFRAGSPENKPKGAAAAKSLGNDPQSIEPGLSPEKLPDPDPLSGPASPATSELSGASPAPSALSSASSAASELSIASLAGPETGPLPPPETRKPYVFKGRGRPSAGSEALADGPETRELRL